MTENDQKKPTIGILQFPGSNCDMDCIQFFKKHFDIELKKIWHSENVLPDIDGLIIPGGFSYGDYLRSGSLASHAPLMEDVRNFADDGGSIIGICNGFQILTESHLLPGVLLKNSGQKFICKFSKLRPCSGQSVYQKTLKNKTYDIPVAHGEGRYYIDDASLKILEANSQIVFRYADDNGEVTPEANPNGSVSNIAGICSKNGRVLGMMPHPERAIDKLLGSEDGLAIWEAFMATIG